MNYFIFMTGIIKKIIKDNGFYYTSYLTTLSKSDITGCSEMGIERSSSGNVEKYWVLVQTENNSQSNQKAGKDYFLS